MKLFYILNLTIYFSLVGACTHAPQGGGSEAAFGAKLIPSTISEQGKRELGDRFAALFAIDRVFVSSGLEDHPSHLAEGTCREGLEAFIRQSKLMGYPMAAYGFHNQVILARAFKRDGSVRHLVLWEKGHRFAAEVPQPLHLGSCELNGKSFVAAQF